MDQYRDVITRFCIKEDLTFVQSSGSGSIELSRDDLLSDISKWKYILVKEFDAKPGQKIVLAMTSSFHYHALIFAAVELGLILVVDWPHVYEPLDYQNPKILLYGKIDIFIADKTSTSSLETQRDILHCRKHVYYEDFVDYQIVDHHLFQTLDKTFNCTPDSTFLMTVSSGTTGDPKLVLDSHKKIYQMSKRMAKYLMPWDGNCYHEINLHHGNSCTLFFLPAYMTGKKQYIGAPIKFSAQWIVDNQINYVFAMSNQDLTLLLNTLPVLDYKLNLITLYQITEQNLKQIKEKNVYKVTSVFGDTTIGVGFFLKQVDNLTDSTNYSVYNMGKPLDDFYTLELRENNLWIKCSELNEDWATSNDEFEIVNGDWIFKGRSNAYRINEQWIKLIDLEKKVTELFGINNATVVVDHSYMKIYLAIWTPAPEAEIKFDNFLLDQYNGLRVSYVLRDHSFDSFWNNRKIDNSKIRQYCRTQLDKTKLLTPLVDKA